MKLVMNLLLPAVALAVITLAIAYPKPPPTDLLAIFHSGDASVRVIDTEKPSYVRTLLETHAKASPAVEPAVLRVSECLEDLAFASAERRQACAPLIVEALAAIDLAERGRDASFPLPDPNPGLETIQSQIAVAAIDLCRTEWLQLPNPTMVPDSPVCEAADVRLANTRHPP